MKYYLILIFIICITNTKAQINFVDRSSILGLSNPTGEIIFGGSGVSFVDYNKDGLDDITLATGDGQTVKFYKNLDGVIFIEESLLPTLTNYQTRSVTWIDYDNDGDKDLFVTSDTDGNRLFKNENNNLTDVTLSAGFPTDNIFTYGASWGDVNNDGCLDVYISNRIGATVITNYFYQNNCDGTFSELTNTVGLNNTPALTFCSAFFDFNNDGWQDLYVANDKFKQNYLYKNNGDGSFTDVSISSGTDLVIDAMSVTIDDYNSDGYFDIFMTNTPNDISTPTGGSILLKNNGDETFSDVSIISGTQMDTFSWGSNFLDADNDGDLDLYLNSQNTGNDGFPSYGFFDALGNGTFNLSTNSGFIGNTKQSYSSAIGDYNNDGKLDIISTNNVESTVPFFWKNESVNTNNYLALTLEGTISNKDAVGSVIEISINGEKQYRYLLSGEGYMSQNSNREIFGLGTNLTVDYIKVTWLSGVTDTLFNVNANQTLHINEGSTLNTGDFGFKNQFTYYPNPVKNTLTLSGQQNITNVTMYNMLGQEVLRLSPNAVNTEVDMSSLVSGAYFVNVSVADTTQTIRIIKQ